MRIAQADASENARLAREVLSASGFVPLPFALVYVTGGPSPARLFSPRRHESVVCEPEKRAEARSRRDNSLPQDSKREWGIQVVYLD